MTRSRSVCRSSRSAAKVSLQIPSFAPQKKEALIGAEATGWLDNANEMLGIVDHFDKWGFLGLLRAVT